MTGEPMDGQADIFGELGTITVHCFFQRWCQHFEMDQDPAEASRRMEAHYSAKHYGHHLNVVNAEVEGAWRSTQPR
jgi:hypothetical protein